VPAPGDQGILIFPTESRWVGGLLLDRMERDVGGLNKLCLMVKMGTLQGETFVLLGGFSLLS
jgi:hypothetical protein